MRIHDDGNAITGPGNRIIYRLVSLLLLVTMFVGPSGPARPALPVVYAATVDVACSAAALVTAIENAEANTEPDVLNLAAGCTYSLTEQLPEMSSEITINGNGATLHGGGGDRVFEVAVEGILRLSDVTISSVNTTRDGGAISNFGYAELTSVTMSNNTADDGGAIENDGGTMILNNVTISNNTGDDGGGIFNRDGTMELTDVVVDSNTAQGADGGGIYTDGGSITATNLTLDGNSVLSGDGGGLSIRDSSVTATNLTAINNSASETGGGVYNNTGTVTITDITVSDNTSQLTGGGIANDYGTVVLNQGMVSGNDTYGILGNNNFGYGGGILNNDGDMKLTGITVSDNTADDTDTNIHGRGGGIDNNGSLSLVNCIVENNTAFGRDTRAEGGGIRNDQTLVVAGSIIRGNVVQGGSLNGGHGGGIETDSNDDTQLIVVNSEIYNNTAESGDTQFGGRGGGICVDDNGSVTLQYSSVYNNTAESTTTGAGEGGGIWQDSSTMHILNSAVLNNHAQGGSQYGGEGGGVWHRYGHLEIVNSTISGNLADGGSDRGGQGGGVFATGDTLSLVNTTITNNTVTGGVTELGSGGGVYNRFDNQVITFTNNLIAGNTTNQTGPDCFNDDELIVSQGYNLIGDDTGCGFSTIQQATDLVQPAGSTIDPLLNALADNGGPTQTHAPQAGSPVIDAIPAANCQVANDQRGIGRPVGNDCDIGAYETTSSGENSFVWSGAGTTNDWTDGANWVGGIAPGANDSVVFNATSSKDATLNSSVSVGNIIVEASYGGTLTINDPLTLDNLLLFGGTVMLGAALDVKSTLMLLGGTLDVGSGNHPINVTESFQNHGGTFNPRLGTVTMDGTTTTLECNAETTFYNLVVEDTTTLVETALFDNVVVSNNLTNHGIIRREKPASYTGYTTLGLTGISIRVPIEKAPVYHNPMDTFIVDRRDQNHPAAPTYTGVYWDIEAVGDDTYTAEVTLPFETPDVNDQVCRYSGAGTVWDCAVSSFDATANTITRATITETLGLSGEWAVYDDNNVLPELSVSDANVSEVLGGTAQAEFTVQLSKPVGYEVSVSYQTGDDTATAPDDYIALAPAELTIPSGETTRTVSVTVLADLLVEGDETFFVTLDTPVNATIADAQGVGTIADDPPPIVQFSNASYDISETDGRATIAVTLDSAATQEVTVDYATSDGMAIAGSDYTDTSGTLTIASGETSGSFNVLVMEDTEVEGDETVSLTLSNPTNAILGTPANATLTIADVPPPSVQFSNASYAISETDGRATIAVTLDSAATQEVKVDYATSDDTAVAGSDYTDTSGTLTIPDGETNGSFDVPISSDTETEGDETVSLTLSNPTNAILGTLDNTTLTIVDVPPMTVQFSSASYTASEADGSATIAVMLNSVATQEVTVVYATSDDTAEAGSDYTDTSGTLTIPIGETSGSFDVPITDDSRFEATETLTLTLSNPAPAMTILLGTPDTAVLTIADDEVSLQGVTINGPSAEGTTGTTYAFTATANPDTATLPIAYTWEATDLTDITHTGSGLQDTVSFTWSTPGAKTVTVTASNGAGDVTASQTIEITEPEPSVAWTLLFYLSGDNESQYLAVEQSINWLEEIADNADIQMVALWDGKGANNTTLTYIEHDTTGNIVSTPIEADWMGSEMNMGDPQTLQDFVQWARETYPSEYTLLSLFDHGGGWIPDIAADVQATWLHGGSGLAWDETSGDFLTMHEIASALQPTTATHGKLDIVLYDACLMATIESAYALREDANYLVASQNVMVNTSHYNRYIPTIDRTTTPVQLATTMVEKWRFAMGEGGAISALDLSKLDGSNGIVSTVDAMATALRNEDWTSTSALDELFEVYEEVQKFDYDEDGSIEQYLEGYSDLFHLAELLSNSGLSQASRDAAADLKAALEPAQDGFVVRENHQNRGRYDLKDAHGVSIYLPLGEELYIGQECKAVDVCAPSPAAGCIKLRDYYTDAAPPTVMGFVTATQWDEFLNEVIEAQYCQTASVQVSSTTDGSRLAGFPTERPVNILTETREGNLNETTRFDLYLPTIRK